MKRAWPKIVFAGIAAIPACGPAEAPRHPGPAPTASASANPSVAVSAGPVEKIALAVRAQPVTSPIELFSGAGGRGALAVSQAAGDPDTWARWIRRDGTMGALWNLQGEHVVSAIDTSETAVTIVTSDGDRLCFTTFDPASSKGDRHACTNARPMTIVPVAGADSVRLAWIGQQIAEPPGSKPRIVVPTPKKPTTNKPAKPAAAKPPKPGATKPGATNSTKKPGSTKKPATKKKPAGRPAPPPPKAQVSLTVTWSSATGAIEGTAQPTGVKFERPLMGMTLIDAAPKAGGIDVLFYETAPKRKGATPLGSARLGLAHLGSAGALAPGERWSFHEDDLDYGHLTTHFAPQLLANDAGTVIVARSRRNGGCHGSRVVPPSGAPISGARCLIDPLGASNAASDASLEALLSAGPRRAPGQIKDDPTLVTWARDRGFFVEKNAISSIDAGGARVAPTGLAPFAATRAPIAWAAFSPRGEGFAWAGDQLWHLDLEGQVRAVPEATIAAFDALGPVEAAMLRRPEIAGDPARIVRIGDAAFVVDRRVARLLPSAMTWGPDVIAHADATRLVGGSEQGLWIRWNAGKLDVDAVSPEGTRRPLTSIDAPVRHGLDAVQRKAGGAIVAGRSTSAAGEIVAFAIDAAGRASDRITVPMRAPQNALGVHLVARPEGGAWLFDDARTRVVWLSENAEIQGEMSLATETGACRDGSRRVRQVPVATPGQVIDVPQMRAEGTCVVGDAAWGPASKTLRWFHTETKDLDVTPFAGVVAISRPADAAPATAPSIQGETRAPSPGTPTCRPDMVLVASTFCIDRFESSLIDRRTERPISPDFPSSPKLLDLILADWAIDRKHWGDVHARALPLPSIPLWQMGQTLDPMAVARFGARPAGYVTGLVAAAACESAGKRLCSLAEHQQACRGETDTDFPYGPDFADGACNVFREDHPAAILHQNASYGHTDPRLNRVRAAGKPLFEPAGSRPRCRSVWGNDAVYDLVGNLDEWVDEGDGAFAGGFYARSTRAGCDAVITAHPKIYADYSTGVRCCTEVGGATPATANVPVGPP